MRHIGWIAAAAIAVAVPAFAQQQDFSKVEVKTTDLGHDTYMLEGAGGNVTIAVGTDGVIMVDSEFAPMHDKLKAAIAKVTDKPVKYLVNTHYHGDHTGGNALMEKDGATIVADANVTNRLEHPLPGLNGQTPPPAPKEALPAKTFKTKMTLKEGGRTAVLTHVANAHTDGDTYVYFPDANVLATGDIVGSTRFPNIDVRSGGGIKGMIAAVNVFLKLAKDDTKIVPGHGTLMTKADLQNYRKVLMTARDTVAKLKKEGMSEDQVAAAKPLAALGKERNADEMQTERFTRLVYQSV